MNSKLKALKAYVVTYHADLRYSVSCAGNLISNLHSCLKCTGRQTPGSLELLFLFLNKFF